MRVEDCIVDVRRRSAGGCIDLACVFQRQFAGPIARLTLVFAIPSLAVSWLILRSWDQSFVITLLIWSVFAALFGGALVSGIGPQVFGQPFSVRRALAGLASRLPLYLTGILLIRILQYLLSFCLILPAVLTIPWIGFLAEIVFLEQAPAGKINARLRSMISGENYLLVLVRWTLLFLFVLILAAGLFTGIVFMANFLFNIPGPLDRMEPGTLEDPGFLMIFLSEPATAILIQVCLWLTLPLARLAWFFYYLDGRIRSECWDLDVAFQVEANRLESLA